VDIEKLSGALRAQPAELSSNSPSGILTGIIHLLKDYLSVQGALSGQHELAEFVLHDLLFDNPSDKTSNKPI
jgi:hypothetical protein